MPDDVQAAFQNNHHVVTFRDKIVATVTPTAAQIAGLSESALARKWAQDLRDGLAGLNIDKRTAYSAIKDEFRVATGGETATEGKQAPGEREVAVPQAPTAGETPADKQLAALIHSRLKSDKRLRGQALQIEVHNGDVTVRGTVPNRQTEDDALQLIRETEGVELVRSDLRVQDH